VKADKAKALDMIAKGEGGFLDRDLYPFCFNISDGKVHPFPNPNAKAFYGTDQRAATDTAGKKLWTRNLRRRAKAGRGNIRSELCFP
jgi:hypothetical protein